MANDQGDGGFMAGFLLGGILGVVVGLALAPKAGQEARAELWERSEGLRERAEYIAAQARERLRPAIDEAKEMLKPAVDEIRAAAASLRRREEGGQGEGEEEKAG